MPKLDKSTNLYERTEAICQQIKGKRNLAQKDTATIGLLTIMNEIADSGKTIEELLGDEGKEWRVRVRDLTMPLYTAAKNYQNSYAFPSELMPKAETTGDMEEFA